jgi:hypothetical protein
MNSGRFKKGQVPWNKGLKGLHHSPQTEFKKGEFVGDEHPSWQGGIHKSGRDGVHVWTGNGKRTRRSRVNYEKAYGPIPKGYVIYHRDGNKDNDNPSNLVAITRGELMKINLRNRKNNRKTSC